MCGIAGFYDASIDATQHDQSIQAMLQAIAHRGPDARKAVRYGSLSLGHNRLSIIDLHEVANQPMERQGRCLVFNGEIYNYLEIRTQLQSLGHTFYTSSDTEVILVAYQEWGAACVDRFIGMWAFALWDSHKNELFCSRDRFGIKPFYFIHEGSRFYFSSEVKALKTTPVFRSALNQAQIARFLQLGWMSYQEETFYQHVYQLQAAHNLILKLGQAPVIQRYWDVSTYPKTQESFTSARASFRDLFFDSIRLHLRSDVEVGSCLSGGIDSSAIVSTVSRLHPDLKFNTFTIFYGGTKTMDEREFAQSVTQKYPNLVAHTYEPAETDVHQHFDHFLHHQDFPVAGSSPFSQYFVMQLAGKHGIKVMLDGQGSDEYLIGYLRSYYRLIGNALPGRHALALWKEHIRREGYGVTESLKRFGKGIASWILDEQALAALEYKQLLPFLAHSPKVPFRLANDHRDKVDNFLYHLVFNTELPSLLHYEDRNSMAFSIESRVPFLDHRLVEYAFTLPTDYKAHQGITKYILREALKDVLPEKVYARTDKKGFVSPGEIQWLRGPLKHILDTPLQPIAGINQTKAQRVLEAYRKGDNTHAKLVWRLAVLNYWNSKS